MSQSSGSKLTLQLKNLGQEISAEKNSSQETRSRAKQRPNINLSFDASQRKGSPMLGRAISRGQSMDINLRHTALSLPVRRHQSVEDHTLREIMQSSGKLTFEDGYCLSGVQTTDLKKLEDLGSGTCGHVVKMIHTRSKHVMAVKQMRKSGVPEENRRIYMDLDVVLKCTECPNIVHCYGYFITESDVWICMEVLDSCLEKLQAQRKAPVPEDILGYICVSVLKALYYLKTEHRVIHRDVKPSNILLDKKGNVKLCDFGIAGRLVNSNAVSRNAGVAGYIAPERIDPKKAGDKYDIRSDVWSLGIAVVELARGEHPYSACTTDFELLVQVVDMEPPKLDPLKYSSDLCDFVCQCLSKDVRRRPKYDTLLQHPFIRKHDNPTLATERVAEWFCGERRRSTQEPIAAKTDQ